MALFSARAPRPSDEGLRLEVRRVSNAVGRGPDRSELVFRMGRNTHHCESMEHIDAIPLPGRENNQQLQMFSKS